MTCFPYKSLYLFVLCVVPILGFAQKEVKTYYDVEQNQVKEVFTVLNNDIRNGKYVKYHFDGGAIVRGFYKEGYKTGLWEYFHDSGIRSAMGDFINDTLSGHWIYFHRNGRVKSEGDFVMGQKKRILGIVQSGR